MVSNCFHRKPARRDQYDGPAMNMSQLENFLKMGKRRKRFLWFKRIHLHFSCSATSKSCYKFIQVTLLWPAGNENSLTVCSKISLSGMLYVSTTIQKDMHVESKMKLKVNTLTLLKFHCMYPYFIDMPLRPQMVYKVQRKNPKQLKSTYL